MSARSTSNARKVPLLARVRVGTKLMLLVLLPVCVLLGLTVLSALAQWRDADVLRGFRTATQVSFATVGAGDELAVEREDDRR
jgi:hypothetical protein